MDFIAPAGGWAMPATDLVRIISALDTYASPTGFSTPFSKDICFAMGALVPGVVDVDAPDNTSLRVLVTEAGWYVSRNPATDPTKPTKVAVDNKVISHNGAVDGSSAIAARDRRGNAFAIVLNTDYYRTTGVEGAMAEDTIESLLAELSKAAQKVGLQFSWPDYDLFPLAGLW